MAAGKLDKKNPQEKPPARQPAWLNYTQIIIPAENPTDSLSVQNRWFSSGFIIILAHHMDGVLQKHLFSLGVIEMLLRHMDGYFQKHWFSIGFIEIVLRHMDGVIQK